MLTMESLQLRTPELKGIASSRSPCITILVPVENLPRENRRGPGRLKRAVQEATQILAEKGVGPADIANLLGGIETIGAGLEIEPEHLGLVILRSPDVSRHFLTHEPLQESVRVGEHFYIKPLLSLREADRNFFILALSQKNIRFFRCDRHDAQEVPLPKSVPKSLEEAMQTRQPDHMLDNRSTAGPSAGSMKGVMFGTSTDRDAKDEYLWHFFRSVDKGVYQILKDQQVPLVVAGVEYEVSIYRQVNSYQHLVEDAVYGAPDGMKDEELHKRAFEAVQKAFDKQKESTLAEFERLGTLRASTDLREIVKAAFDGRVNELFLARGIERPGVFIERTRKVQLHTQPKPDHVDLINLAAVHTLRNGGQAFLLRPERMPHRKEMAAFLRY